MAIDTFVPRQFSGESPPETRSEPLVFTQEMLDEGDEEGSSPRSVLTELYGEQGEGWKTVALEQPGTLNYVFAKALKVPMLEVIVVEEGQERVLEGELPKIEEAPETGARVVEQFKGSGEDRVLIERTNRLKLDQQTYTSGRARREVHTEAYGPETVSEKPNEGGWFYETDLPKSKGEMIDQNAGIEPVLVYATMAGLAMRSSVVRL